MFYFQQLLNTALAGIDGTAIISTVTNFAFAILLIGFLIGLYQAAFRGGDLQALAGTADQVSGRCHDRFQLGDSVSRRQRLLQHDGEFHRQQFRRGRHVPELDGTTPATVRQQPLA